MLSALSAQDFRMLKLESSKAETALLQAASAFVFQGMDDNPIAERQRQELQAEFQRLTQAIARVNHEIGCYEAAPEVVAENSITDAAKAFDEV